MGRAAIGMPTRGKAAATAAAVAAAAIAVVPISATAAAMGGAVRVVNWWTALRAVTCCYTRDIA